MRARPTHLIMLVLAWFAAITVAVVANTHTAEARPFCDRPNPPPICDRFPG